MVNYLRISVTDRCNLRCIYCLPRGVESFLPHSEILSYEEIAEIVKMLSEIGIRKVRLTGGEPLVRREIENLVKLIKLIPSISEISITTNGLLLGEKAAVLKEAGLDRVNISMNTLQEKRYEKISGYDNFRDVWNSIDAALKTFEVVKLNTILFKEINDDEIIDFAKLSVEYNLCVRFIEYFSTQNEFLNLERRFVPNKVVKEVIEKRFGKLLPADDVRGNGPAINYRIPGAKGSIGFIDSNEGYFCDRCNRLRLSSVGKLYPCLFSPFNIDLKEMLRGNLPRPKIMKAIKGLIRKKHNYSKPIKRKYEFAMNTLGG